MTPHTKVFTTQHGHLHNTTMKCFLVALGSGAAATQHDSIKPPSARNTRTHARTHATRTHPSKTCRRAISYCATNNSGMTAHSLLQTDWVLVVYLQCLLAPRSMRHLNSDLMYCKTEIWSPMQVCLPTSRRDE